MVTYSCNPWDLGGWGRRVIIQIQTQSRKLSETASKNNKYKQERLVV